jgi:hypothetical protein
MSAQPVKPGHQRLVQGGGDREGWSDRQGEVLVAAATLRTRRNSPPVVADDDRAWHAVG